MFQLRLLGGDTCFSRVYDGIFHLYPHCSICINTVCVCLPPAEDTFLSAIINYTNSSTVHFKLSPTYVLYMACRYILSPSYRPDMSPSERTHKVIAIVNKMVSMMEGVIQVSNATFQTFFLLCVLPPS